MGKIYFSWMYPRSLTTVFMQALKARGDFRTIFQPFIPLYWGKRAHLEGVCHQDYEGWPTEYPDIVRQICKIAEESPTPLYIKEVTNNAINHILDDEEFLRLCIHVFQIRDPRRVVVSSWKLRGTQKTCRADTVSGEASWRLCQRLTELKLHPLEGGTRPLVIDGDDLRENPEGIMKAWCRALDLPYKAEALSWTPEWRPEYDHWAQCYHDVAESSGFDKSKEAFLYDERLIDTIMNDLPLLQNNYEVNKVYYDKMKPFALKPL